MATSKQADIHTTSANAVTLVWRSLRLAPITLEIIMSSRFAVFLAKYMLQSESSLESNTSRTGRCFNQTLSLESNTSRTGRCFNQTLSLESNISRTGRCFNQILSLKSNTVKTGKSTQERATRVRAYNYVKIEARQNFPPVLKIVTRTAQAT